MTCFLLYCGPRGALSSIVNFLGLITLRARSDPRFGSCRTLRLLRAASSSSARNRHPGTDSPSQRVLGVPFRHGRRRSPPCSIVKAVPRAAVRTAMAKLAINWMRCIERSQRQPVEITRSRTPSRPGSHPEGPPSALSAIVFSRQGCLEERGLGRPRPARIVLEDCAGVRPGLVRSLASRQMARKALSGSLSIPSSETPTAWLISG